MPNIGHFHKPKKALKEHNFSPKIYEMDEKGFSLGVPNRVKVMCRAGRKPTHDGMRELIAVTETICAAKFSHHR